LTRSLHEFDVEEQTTSYFQSRYPNVTVRLDSVVSFDSLTKVLYQGYLSSVTVLIILC